MPAGSRGEIDPVETVRRWVSASGRGRSTVVPLPGDVSPRMYFRVHLADGSSAIATLYGHAIRSVCQRFLATTRLLEAAGVRVPRILQADHEAGLVLLEDAGARTVFEQFAGRETAAIDDPLRRAATLIPRLRDIPTEAVEGLNPPLDAHRLWRELEQTWELVLHPEGLAGGRGTAPELRDALRTLCQRLEDSGLVPSHRDFMARNLIESGGELIVLDHQDLCLAPPGYDLASLLNDSLFASSHCEAELLERLAPSPANEIDYRRAVVQRCLKAVGTFQRFASLGVDRHLSLIPPTLARAWAQCRQIPELAGLCSPLAPIWEPWLANLLD